MKNSRNNSRREQKSVRTIKQFEFPDSTLKKNQPKKRKTPATDPAKKGTRSKRNRRNWTPQEDQILRRNYTRHGSQHTAELLGRTVTSVQSRALKLEIPGHGKRPWSAMELKYLKKNYPRRTAEAIARTLKRTPGSVRGQIHILGLGSYSPQPWTPKQEAYMRKHYGSMRVADMAAELGKTPVAVEIKAGRMGLRRKNIRLTPKQKQWAVDNFGTLSYETIGQKLGISASTVAKMAHEHGHRPRPNNRAWTEKDDAYVRKHYGRITNREIAEALERTAPLVGWRAAKLGITRDPRNTAKMRQWTKKEDAYLMRNRTRMTHGQIAEALDRTRTSVSGRVAWLRKKGKIG